MCILAAPVKESCSSNDHKNNIWWWYSVCFILYSLNSKSYTNLYFIALQTKILWIVFGYLSKFLFKKIWIVFGYACTVVEDTDQFNNWQNSMYDSVQTILIHWFTPIPSHWESRSVHSLEPDPKAPRKLQMINHLVKKCLRTSKSDLKSNPFCWKTQQSVMTVTECI
jgi:hypothetical protein